MHRICCGGSERSWVRSLVQQLLGPRRGGLSIQLIGLDVSTDDKKCGLARATVDGARVLVAEVCVPTAADSAVSIIAQWLKATQSSILAIDAPLGWPGPLSAELLGHHAGEELRTTADLMFRRETDRIVYQMIGKQSLDVGADRIARTAHSAVQRIRDLRECTGLPLPLAWAPAEATPHRIIEVYPAATLIAHGIDASKYKEKAQLHARQRILARLREIGVVVESASLAEANADALDAIVCVVAASDFLRGNTKQPTSLQIALREGWIWLAQPAIA
jgi:predicted RNase H-like nuclease